MPGGIGDSSSSDPSADSSGDSSMAMTGANPAQSAQWNAPNAVPGDLANSVPQSSVLAGSTDTATELVAQTVQRLGQMYNLVSEMSSKYNQEGMTAINNLKA
jgi:hypothetical protein